MAVDNLKDLYMDYLISSTQLTTCTGLSKVLDGEISHDRFTRMLSKGTFDSRSLWLQNKVMDKKTGKEKRKASVGKNELFRRMTAQCGQNLYIDYVLADSWFCSNENMKHLLKLKLDFAMAIKSNRLVALSEEDRNKGNWINIESLDLGQVAVTVWLKGLDRPLSLTRQVFKNGDDTADLYLVCSDSGLSVDQISALYKRRWSVEQYHKAVKQVTSFGKSPAKRAETQSNHFYLSIMAYSKMEILKVRSRTNEFQLKSRIYYNALKVAMEQIKELSTNTYKNAA